MSEALKLDEQPFDLNSLALEASDIEERGLKDEQLFVLDHDGEIIGPVSQEDLESIQDEHASFLENIKVRRLSEAKWHSFFEHKKFERRTPRPVAAPVNPAPIEAPGRFHLVQEGQVKGPYTLSHIKKMLDDGTLLYTHLVSLDQGSSWIKVHQLEGIDRREIHKKEHLPSGPTDQMLSRSKSEAYVDLERAKREFSETEAIAGLAYIERLSSGKAHESLASSERTSKKKNAPQEVTATHEIKAPQIQEVKSKRWPYILILGLSIVGLFVLYITWSPEQKLDLFTKKEAQKKPVIPNRSSADVKKVETKANVPQVQDEKRIEETRNRRPSLLERRKQAAQERREAAEKERLKSNDDGAQSFSNSAAFRKAQERKRLSDDPYLEEGHYDDGSDPVQQDPVRSQVSNETYDPVENYDPESTRAPAGEGNWPAPEEQPNNDALFDGEYVD